MAAGPTVNRPSVGAGLGGNTGSPMKGRGPVDQTPARRASTHRFPGRYLTVVVRILVMGAVGRGGTLFMAEADAPAVTMAGKDLFKYAHEHREEIVWMSQNTNHLPTHPAIHEAMEGALKRREYTFYPYSKGLFDLPQLILQDLGLSPDTHRARVTAGGLEGLYEMTRVLLGEGDEVVASDPSFLPIHQHIRLSGAKPVELPVYREPWRLTLDQVKEAITDRTEMLLLIDPLNPLGTEYPRDVVRGFAELAEDHDLWLLHDVTYRDFAEDPVLATEFAPERTLVAYSFSKNAGFAGLRVGAAVATHDVMDRLDPARVNVLGTNVLAQHAARAALETKDAWIDDVVGTALDNQARIKTMVDDLPGVTLPVYPSRANMFVLDVSERGVDPDRLMERLLMEHHVFVRGGPYLSDRFGSNFVRVSFTVAPEGVDRFVEHFPTVLDDLSAKT